MREILDHFKNVGTHPWHSQVEISRNIYINSEIQRRP